uniref:Uncharacterized protein n=1 Tax=Trichogramma kaykai TaxID=54128 RepID=A0ABD2XJ77_9HYME
MLRDFSFLEPLGYPHRMRFKAFNSRYRLIAPFKQLRRSEEQAIEDTRLILQNAQELRGGDQLGLGTSWALGKRHIFLGEATRQQLEQLRGEIRQRAATDIQASWRGWRIRRRWTLRRGGSTKHSHHHHHQQLPPPPLIVHHPKQHHHLNPHHHPGSGSNHHNNHNQLHPGSQSSSGGSTLQRNIAAMQTAAVAAAAAAAAGATGTRPRPQPIAGTPPPDPMEMKVADQKTIQQTGALYGLDLERPPPLPPSRSYTVTGNTKLGYPQTRVMKKPFPGKQEGEGEVVLLKGETVLVIGASQHRGHLLVEYNNATLSVPYQFMELKPCNINV